MNPIVIFALFIAGCALSWWLGKRGADDKIKALEGRLSVAATELAAERSKGERGDIGVALAQPVKFTARLLESPKGRKRDSHGRFAR